MNVQLSHLTGALNGTRLPVVTPYFLLIGRVGLSFFTRDRYPGDSPLGIRGKIRHVPLSNKPGTLR